MSAFDCQSSGLHARRAEREVDGLLVDVRVVRGHELDLTSGCERRYVVNAERVEDHFERDAHAGARGDLAKIEEEDTVDRCSGRYSSPLRLWAMLELDRESDRDRVGAGVVDGGRVGHRVADEVRSAPSGMSST